MSLHTFGVFPLCLTNAQTLGEALHGDPEPTWVLGCLGQASVVCSAAQTEPVASVGVELSAQTVLGVPALPVGRRLGPSQAPRRPLLGSAAPPTTAAQVKDVP